MRSTEIEKIFRDEAGRALATLIRLVGDFDLAEDALQDAFAVALEPRPALAAPAALRAPIRAPGWSMSDATRQSTGSAGESRCAGSRESSRTSCCTTRLLPARPTPPRSTTTCCG